MVIGYFGTERKNVLVRLEIDKAIEIFYTLQFGRPGSSFSPFPLDSTNWNQKHQERTDGPEHRRPSHHTRTMRSFLCWHPEREKYTKTSVGKAVEKHQGFCFPLFLSHPWPCSCGFCSDTSGESSVWSKLRSLRLWLTAEAWSFGEWASCKVKYFPFTLSW